MPLLSPSPTRARCRRRLYGWALLSFACLLPVVCAQDDAPPPQSRRMAFKRAWQLAQQGGNAWQASAASLQNYVLYPYLQAEALEQGISQFNLPAVEAYLQHYPNQLPARDLRQAALLELAKREDWHDFNRLYQPGLGLALQCDAVQAKLAQGVTLDFNHDLGALWQQPRLPSACDAVLAAARSQGLLTPQRIWQRIELAITARAGGTVASLAAMLPPTADATEATQWASALQNPATAVTAAGSWADTPRGRAAAVYALIALARRDSHPADAAWPALSGHFSFSDEQRQQLQQRLALYAAADFVPGSQQRLAALPAAEQSDATREWRARLALAAQDWPAVLTAIAAMPPAQQNQEEWRYFKARALAAQGDQAQANALYGILAENTGYFGFLAADRLHRDYALCAAAPPQNPAAESALLNDSLELQRAFELFAVGLPRLARREWDQALATADPQPLQLAAALAYRHGWYDRPIRVYNHGPSLHYYEARFPLDNTPDGPKVGVQAQQVGIDPAWAYAIIRMESAWTTDARSDAGARGLMQLLPPVAAELAQRNGLAWHGASSLDDAPTNVALGTRYLAQLAARYQGASWLASAAYNAGPQKLARWLAARPKLPPDLFVATIPYKDTRNYVANVMTYAVIYDWRLHDQAAELDSRMPAIGASYTAPATKLPRRQLFCPHPPVASTSRPATELHS